MTTPTTTTGTGSVGTGNPAGLTTWRSNEASPGQSTSRRGSHDPTQQQHQQQQQQQVTFSTTSPPDRTQWAPQPSAYPYDLGQEQQRPTQFPPAPQQSQYQHPVPVAPYQNSQTQQQGPYRGSMNAPNTEFQGLSVTSPPSFQMPQPGGFVPQPAQYQMQTMQQVSPGSEFPPPSQMQVTPMPPAAYQPQPGNTQYQQHQTTQGQQVPVHFREDPAARSYQYQQYPPHG